MEDDKKDWSLKWFGMTDEEVDRIWKSIEAMPRGTPHKDEGFCYCRMCCLKRKAELREM